MVITNTPSNCSIDGWGIGAHPPEKGDAIATADTPVMDNMKKDSPFVELEASGLSVGLPEGLMGNSEVGHLNIGAGRVVWQDIVRIDQAMKKNEFLKQENILKSFDHAKSGNGRIHILGLVSDGGVHSHINHLFHLLEKAKEQHVPEAYVHFFGDGRDVDPRSSDKYMKQLVDKMKDLKYGKVATAVGRYYAMDRDKRWERIKIA
jgi:2,3-bisphosphoglycerate-independent phosphoglycerate mutase